uniref:Uncharacterized protein n=1 Tax=Siphoviridae sp. ctMCY8 TaxID=2827854 RepID=A0A8S5TAP4_9CAUD|nr:MAG TPA: hypothetical protein [Siphoviridae sp. ctMCY8]DAL89203.1 MAG TPA: hypothetical protein [Caudoviricetes sp.]DAQ79862.1 MAG TPA: hypothetical protein [Caudoviricetes sp.]
MCGFVRHKKESVNVRVWRTKKDGVHSSFTRSRAPAYRVHKFVF